MSESQSHATTTANSLGHQLSHAAQLDDHFHKCQPEYEAMIRAVGIQPGGHVLDAGCGTGVFLPLLAELVGPMGRITAIDVAPEGLQSAQQLVNTLHLTDLVTIQEGSVTQLPFADHTFDVVWSANVSQYLTDEQFATSLAEMIRVTKPGGRVAIKEFDATTWQFLPADPLLLTRLFSAQAAAGHTQTIGCLRPPLFRSWLLKAGLTEVWIKNFVSECQPPLGVRDRVFLQNILVWLTMNAQMAAISPEDVVTWRRLGDVHASDHILNRPDFYNRESHILAVGTKPPAAV